MLPIAQKLYVGAQSDLNEMYKSFIQQYGQRYPSPGSKAILCFVRKKIIQVRAFENRSQKNKKMGIQELNSTHVIL